MATFNSEQMKHLSPEYLAEDASKSPFNLSIAFIVIQTFFFVLFIASRLTMRSSSARDLEIYFVPAAYLCCMGQCIIALVQIRLGGLGRHVEYWLLTDPKIITRHLKVLWAESFIYLLSVGFPKLAIVTLYLRIFVHRWIRRLTWAIGIVIVLNFVSGEIILLTICQPIKYNWDKMIKGNCGNEIAPYRYISVPNLFTDVAILLLPIPAFYKLQVSKTKKIGIFVTFLLGGCGIVTAIMRFVNFFIGDQFQDITYNGARTMSWTIVESGTYLICSILPHLYSLLRYLMIDRNCLARLSTLRSRMMPRSTSRRNSILLSSSHGTKSSFTASLADSPQSEFAKLRGEKLQAPRPARPTELRAYNNALPFPKFEEGRLDRDFYLEV